MLNNVLFISLKTHLVERPHDETSRYETTIEIVS